MTASRLGGAPPAKWPHKATLGLHERRFESFAKPDPAMASEASTPNSARSEGSQSGQLGRLEPLGGPRKQQQRRLNVAFP